MYVISELLICLDGGDAFGAGGGNLDGASKSLVLGFDGGVTVKDGGFSWGAAAGVGGGEGDFLSIPGLLGGALSGARGRSGDLGGASKSRSVTIDMIKSSFEGGEHKHLIRWVGGDAFEGGGGGDDVAPITWS